MSDGLGQMPSGPGAESQAAVAHPVAPPPVAHGAIRLAANVSPHVLELRQAGRVVVDYLKVGSWIGMESVADASSGLPRLLHLGDGLSSAPPLPTGYLNNLRALVLASQGPWVSQHIAYSCESVAHDGYSFVPARGTRLLSSAEALANIVRNARQLQAHLPVPLLLEHIPPFPNAAHRHVYKPAFVSQVIQQSGCDLLLDTAHARVSAALLGIPVEGYLSGLPLGRAVEIHVSGPRVVDGVLTDVHEPMEEADYRVLEWVLAHARPQVVTLEYWKDKDAVFQQLARLAEMIRP